MMSQVGQFSSFPHAASRALSLLLENTEMVALKELTTVVSQVALAERVSLELAQVAQEFLATEHWDWRSQTVECCCWACHVGVWMAVHRGP